MRLIIAHYAWHISHNICRHVGGFGWCDVVLDATAACLVVPAAEGCSSLADGACNILRINTDELLAQPWPTAKPRC